MSEWIKLRRILATEVRDVHVLKSAVQAVDDLNDRQSILTLIGGSTVLVSESVEEVMKLLGVTR